MYVDKSLHRKTLESRKLYKIRINSEVDYYKYPRHCDNYNKFEWI